MDPCDGLAVGLLGGSFNPAHAGHLHISTTALARLGTRYTADTLAALRARHGRTRFVWLMGADNLIQIPGWHRWEAIFETVPVAIFDRPSYSLRAFSGCAAKRFRRARIAESVARELAAMAPPAWVFLHGRLSPLSGTELRAGVARQRD